MLISSRLPMDEIADPHFFKPTSLVYHVSYSALLPHQATPASLASTASHQPLVLQAPRSAPVTIASTHHLELVLAEQIAAIVKQAKVLRAAKEAKMESITSL